MQENMLGIYKVWGIVWQNDVLHWAIIIVISIAFIYETSTLLNYCQKSNKHKKVIKKLDYELKDKSKKENDKRKKRLDKWTDEHYKWMEEHLENDKPVTIRNRKKYILKTYPDIFNESTRSNLRFVATLCTAIGLLGTFYGIQTGIATIPLNSNFNNTQSLLSGVSGLLTGMKTAFSTSLMGLGSGSLFTIFLFIADSIRQSQHDQLRRKLHNITVTGKDSREDTANSLKEIAESLKQIDFSASVRASEVLAGVVKNLDPKIIGREVGNQVGSQLDKTVQTRLTPVFNTIVTSQKTLTQITTVQRDVLENLINEMKSQLITPLVQRLNQSALLTQQASQSVSRLNNELGGISEKLASSIVTIQQFQQETLGELQNFAHSLKSTLNDFQMDTKNVLETTGVSISNAVEISIQGMEYQRQAFEASAEQAANTFTGIRENLEQSLATQAEHQKAILEVVYSQFNKILNQSNENFKVQTRTLETVGREASQLMNHAQNSLENTLTNIDGNLQNTHVRVQRELETFRVQYQDSLTQGMESQRQAFEASAEQAANTFTGIRENLEQSLATQAEHQREILQVVYSQFNRILNQSNENFRIQTQTLETVGREASQLMNHAQNSLENTLTNIDGNLQNTHVTVQRELETFRIQYQDSLTQFFNDQNQLLESTLGSQRDALSEVVSDLRSAFAEETQRRQSLMNDLNNTMTQVQRGIMEIDQVSIAIQNRIRGIQELTAAMGLNTGERIAQLQELSRNIGTATQDFSDLLHSWESHLNSYIVTSTEWQTKFFNEADNSMSRVCSGLLETANVLVTIEKNRQLMND